MNRPASNSGEYVVGESHISELAPGPRNAVDRQARDERRARNEADRLRDEDKLRAALAIAKTVACETISDREFFARLRGVDHATWSSWMNGSAARSGKRIPGWTASAIHEVSEEASLAFTMAFFGERRLAG